PCRNGAGVVVLPGDARLDAAPGHLQPRAVETRAPQDVAEHLQYLVEVVLEDAHAHGARVVADAGFDRRGAILEEPVELVRRERLCAAGAQDAAGERRDTRLV